MSTTTRRAQLATVAGQQFGGARDLYEVYGYPRVLTPDDYVALYQRGDIAARVVDAYPDATWRADPVVEGSDRFVKEWDEVWERLQVGAVLNRLDRLTGLGHYGVLLLGLDGGQPLHVPAKGSHQLLYLQPHSERTAKVTDWVTDPSSPRFGMPEMYSITTGYGASSREMQVHHSRVLHVAERALEDPSIGTPRLESVFNRLSDLDKLLGGGAEIYWQNAAMILAFMADKDTQWSQQEREEMQDQIEEMQNRLRRSVRLRGVTAENLAPGMMGDPSGLIDKEVDFIAGAKGIPQRILLGSEQGELASSQDQSNWSARIAERREQFAGSQILKPLAEKLVGFDVLPSGLEGFSWDEESTLGPKEKAEVAQTKAAALKTYTSAPAAELIVSPEELRTWLGEEGRPPAPPIEPTLDETDPQVDEQFRRVK